MLYFYKTPLRDIALNIPFSEYYQVRGYSDTLVLNVRNISATCKGVQHLKHAHAFIRKACLLYAGQCVCFTIYAFKHLLVKEPLHQAIMRIHRLLSIHLRHLDCSLTAYHYPREGSAKFSQRKNLMYILVHHLSNI